MAVHVLVVDDDPAARRHIEEILKSQGQTVESAESGEAALRRLMKTDAPPISAMILDLVMPEIDGMAVLERLSRHALSVPVIVQTAPGGIDNGASAIRAGAVDFLVKPATPERVRVSLQNALRIGALEGEILRMRLSRSGALSLGDIVMHSPAMERVSNLAARAARSPISVLIEGERGVGKALLARAVHGSSPRKNRPFVTVRCDAIDATAIEATLFGERPDATGGKLAEAAGGTLFLDEIGALPPAAQQRLARFLADADAGRQKLPRGDIRLIAATGSRLIDRVGASGFREDLFNRLNVFTIWLPPLRERCADIPTLARGFLARLAAEAGRPVRGFSAEAMALLMAHDWPGNIRELEHAVFRAVMLCDRDELSPRDFPSIPGAAATGRVTEIRAFSGVADQEQFGVEQVSLTASRADTPSRARYGVARLLDERGEMRSIGGLEEEAIRFAIGHYGGRLSEVARRLGIGRSTLYRKMKDYGIAPEAAGELKELAQA
jgi:DNA-binding NtrC family response regulator